MWGRQTNPPALTCFICKVTWETRVCRKCVTAHRLLPLVWLPPDFGWWWMKSHPQTSVAPTRPAPHFDLVIFLCGCFDLHHKQRSWSHCLSVKSGQMIPIISVYSIFRKKHFRNQNSVSCHPLQEPQRVEWVILIFIFTSCLLSFCHIKHVCPSLSFSFITPPNSPSILWAEFS